MGLVCLFLLCHFLTTQINNRIEDRNRPDFHHEVLDVTQMQSLVL